MEVHPVQPSRAQVAMQHSRRLQPLRFLFLVIIFLQLYLTNSVSLPSICGILVSCVLYTIYVDSKDKHTPDIQPLPSPSVTHSTLPPLSSAALDPDLATKKRPDGGCETPPLPSEPSCPKSLPEGISFPRDSDNGIVQQQDLKSQQGQRHEQDEHHEQDQRHEQQEQQQLPRTQVLSVSAAPWRPSGIRTSSASLNGAKSACAAAATASSTSPSHPPTSTVFVGNMSSAVTESDLYHMFAPFGDIIVARIQRGTKQKGLKMFIGFIDFYAVDSAVAAVRALQGVSLCGRPMRLEFSQAPSAAAMKKLGNMRSSLSSDSLFSEHASATSSTSHQEPLEELEVLSSAIPCSMCQLECAPHIFSSVARCLTCRDTVCVAHLQAHNAAHKGHGHKVFFLSNQNLAQFAQTAADIDSSSRAPCSSVRAAVFTPDATSAGMAPQAVALCSPSSPDKLNVTSEDSFNNSISPQLQWREPVGHFGSSAAAVADDLPWAEAPWSNIAWDSASIAGAGLAPQQQSPSMFVGERSVRSGGSFYGSLW